VLCDARELLQCSAVSEAVKKCTTMAGSVAPREWLRHGGPQKQ